MFSRYTIPAVALGILALGAGSAYAFTGGTFPMSAFSSFSSGQQAAIEKSQEIMANARTEADKVLSDAGISREDMRTAMDAFHTEHMKAVDAALDDGDYAAFKEAVAGTPMADEVTEATFAKLVEIRKLQQSGDRAGAQALWKELADSGFKGPFWGGMMMHHGFGPGMMHDFDGDDDGQ
jgi:hypothetical protein